MPTYRTQGKRSLNFLSATCFAKVRSVILEMPISNSLCGTKMTRRRGCERFVQRCSDFGNSTLFGDFELLFPAATMALGSVDIAVLYCDCTCESTSIRCSPARSRRISSFRLQSYASRWLVAPQYWSASAQVTRGVVAAAGSTS